MDILELQKRLAAAPNLEDVRREAGVSRKTIQRLKAGQGGTLAKFIAVSAALDRLAKQARKAPAAKPERRKDHAAAAKWPRIFQDRRDGPRD